MSSLLTVFGFMGGGSGGTSSGGAWSDLNTVTLTSGATTDILIAPLATFLGCSIKGELSRNYGGTIKTCASDIDFSANTATVQGVPNISRRYFPAGTTTIGITATTVVTSSGNVYLRFVVDSSVAANIEFKYTILLYV